MDVAVLDNLLTVIQKPMWRSLYWPDLYPLPILSAPSQRSLAFHISIYLFLTQHGFVDSPPAISSQCSLKMQYAPSCFLTCHPTYVRRLHINTCKDILLSYRLLLWCLQNTTRRLYQNLSFPFQLSLFSKSLLLCSQVWVLWISQCFKQEVNQRLSLWLAHIWHYHNGILTHCLMCVCVVTDPVCTTLLWSVCPVDTTVTPICFCCIGSSVHFHWALSSFKP